MDRPDDLQAQFRAWKAGGAPDLSEGMRLVAMLRYPDLTPEKWQARLAALYAGVAAPISRRMIRKREWKT
jgi:hypothetical protein